MGTYDVAIIGTNAGIGTLARHLAPSASARYCSCVVTGSRARLLLQHADTKNEISVTAGAHQATRLA